MLKTIDAVFDGKVFRPKAPPLLEPNTPVRLTFETVLPEAEQTTSFLQAARSLNLEGPADWSAKLETYLYGGEKQYGQ